MISNELFFYILLCCAINQPKISFPYMTIDYLPSLIFMEMETSFRNSTFANFCSKLLNEKKSFKMK